MPNPSDAIAKTLVSEEEILSRVAELAEQIQGDFKNSDLVVVGLLTGTLMFLADLVRKIDLPMKLDFIGVSSYRDGTESYSRVPSNPIIPSLPSRFFVLPSPSLAGPPCPSRNNLCPSTMVGTLVLLPGIPNTIAVIPLKY